MAFDIDEAFEEIFKHLREKGWHERDHDERLADEIFARWREGQLERARRGKITQECHGALFDDLSKVLEALYDPETACVRWTMLVMSLELRARDFDAELTGTATTKGRGNLA